MKKAIHLLILFIGLYLSANAQIMPTIGEIFDYEINDEYQYWEYEDENYFPNATRIKIIDKFFSAENDTVFYVRHFNNYTSYWDFTFPGHLVYNFNSYTDTIFFTNLNTLINARYANEINDSCNVSFDTLYYASDFCGVYSYEHYRCHECCFEGQSTTTVYGIGIGLAYYHYQYPSEWAETERKLFYYKKGLTECGHPDLITVSVNEPGIVNKIIRVYPNPADNVIHFNIEFSLRNRVAIYNMLGIMVLSLNEYLGDPVNISSLDNGFYFARIENDQGTHICKFVIDRN